MILASVLEYITGVLLEKLFGKKLWDYSRHKYNLDGYICLEYSLIWGVLAVLMMLYLNPLLCGLLDLIPVLPSLLILLALSILLILDTVSTILAIKGMHKEAERFAQLTEGMQNTSRLLENALTKYIQSRMSRSFPAIDRELLIRQRIEKVHKKEAPKTFAAGCSFYKLVSLFFVGAFLGDITETIFCWITTGTLMSRSSVVYGPFSIVWGFGCAFLTALLYRYKNKSDRFLFLTGTLLGGAYEYICSVLSELIFGTVFWDYSSFAFNLGGRINLLFCFFWGIAAVVWFKLVYPHISAWIEKLPVKGGTIICNFLIVFMIFDLAISSLALTRYTERQTIKVEQSTDTTNTADISESVFPDELRDFLDAHFGDKRMAKVYPNAKIVIDGVPQLIETEND